jgi:hypothetical protein
MDKFIWTTTYIGNKPASEDIYHHAAVIDQILTIESAVLAGPVTFTEYRNSNRNFGNYLMSELKVNKVTPRSGTTVTLGDSGDSVAIPTGVGFNGFGYRNIVINGDMSIAQRSTSVASITTQGYYTTLDRYWLLISSLGTWTQSQSTDVPSG